MVNSSGSVPQVLTVVAIYIAPGHNYFGHHGQAPGTNETVSVESADCVAGMGIHGDRFFGYKEAYKGQITFFALETHEGISEALQVKGRSPAVYRRNVITEGIDLNTLIGATFTVQGITFKGMAECAPCHWMDEALAPGAESALQGRGGLRAQIVTSGILRVEKSRLPLA